MITIFSAPKPFEGHINIIQRNAIKSWTMIEPKPEIILLGNDSGIAEICKEFKLTHIPKIELNEYGTPLVNSIFCQATLNANNEILCYINADIIIMIDFQKAIMCASEVFPDFLLIGRRYDFKVSREILFKKDWEKKIKKNILDHGKLHSPTGKDYFIFTKKTFNNIPPFAIGRGAWDDWFLIEARDRNKPIVDCSEFIMIGHQNHDYTHVSKSNQTNWKGQEDDDNVPLLIKRKYTTTKDAQFILTNKGIKRRSSMHFFYRYFLYSFINIYRFLKIVIKKSIIKFYPHNPT